MIDLSLWNKFFTMEDFLNHCFVCGNEIDVQKTQKNKEINLPVCEQCRNTEKETNAIDQLNEGLAEGFVCGCI